MHSFGGVRGYGSGAEGVFVAAASSLSEANALVSSVAAWVVMAKVESGAPWTMALGAWATMARLVTVPISVMTVKASATTRAASALAEARAPGGDARKAGLREVWEGTEAIRKRGYGAHPLWLVAGPATQIPFFMTAVMVVRRLAAEGSDGANGLSTGGMFWFKDLTQPAIDLTTLMAPMGPYGAVLPVLTAAALFANVNLNFSAAAAQSRGMTMFKLLLEWMTLPMLVIGLQLPQAMHCYWLTSSAFALAQNTCFGTAFARKALGTDVLMQVTREMINAERGGGGGDALSGEGALVPMDPRALELVKAAAKARSENKNTLAVNLLLQAVRVGSEAGEDENVESTSSAEAVASSSLADSATPLRAENLAKAHPSVLFALGQTYAVLKEWKKSALAYEYSARAEPDPIRRSRALMGAGVARARLGDLDMASEALGEANRLNGTDASIKVALASALKLNGEPERALDVLREAAAIQPDIEERYIAPLERELTSRVTN